VDRLIGNGEQGLQVALAVELLAPRSVTVRLDRQNLVPHEAHGTKLPVEERDLLGRRVDADLEHRQLTNMFCDMVGSSALSTRLDPEKQGDVIDCVSHLLCQ
jgi:class 3 adenylate cyclase